MQQQTVPNAPCTEEDEHILKTALAFVVLRRRLKNSINSNAKSTSSSSTSSTSQSIPVLRSLTASEDIENSSIITPSQYSNAGSRTNINNSGESSCSNPLKRKRQKIAKEDEFSEKNKNALDDKDERTPLPFLRGIRLGTNSNLGGRTSTRAEPFTVIEAKKLHIKNMFQIALSTALPLYGPYISSLKSVQISTISNEKPSSSNTTRTSPIYDYTTASRTKEEMKILISRDEHIIPSATSSVASYAVLDGVLSNLASNLRSLSSHKHRMEREEAEKSTHRHITALDGGKSEYPHGIVYSLFIGSLTEKILDENCDETSCAQTVLAMCTILHRLVFLDSSSSFKLFSDVMISICEIMKRLYHGELFLASRKRGSLREGKRPNGEKTLMIRLPDILAVNCIILLEEIIQFHLSNISTNCSYESSGMCGDEMNTILSEGAGKILNVLNIALEQLILPVPVEEMAAFYIRYVEKIDGRIRAIQRLNNVSQDVESAHSCLNSGAKMMLHTSLFGLIQNLSTYHLDDNHHY